jgi:hypothetical protein
MISRLSNLIYDKMKNKTNKFCRICADEICSYGDKWVHPCKCKGSVEWTHLSCLKEWLNHSKATSCEVCLYKYGVIYKNTEKHVEILNKILPFLVTFTLLFIAFEVTFKITRWTNGNIFEISNFVKNLSYGVIVCFFIVELLCIFLKIKQTQLDPILQNNYIQFYVVLIFILPVSIYKELDNIINSNKSSDIINISDYDL